jgi:hypothetical protein
LTFSIAFDENAAHEPTFGDAVGHIQLGTEVELFESRFGYWSRGDYEQHWRKAAAQLLAGNAASFVVDISSPPRSDEEIGIASRQGAEGNDLPPSFALERVVSAVGLRWIAWPQVNDQVVFQNRLMLPHLQTLRHRLAGRSFDYANPEAAPKSFRPYARMTWRKRRVPISSWMVARADVLSWWEATEASAE